MAHHVGQLQTEEGGSEPHSQTRAQQGGRMGGDTQGRHGFGETVGSTQCH